MNTSRIARVFHTVRHLKPVQVVNRIQRRWARPRWQAVAAPPLRPTRGTWQPPCRREPSLLGPDLVRVFERPFTVRFQNDWTDPQLSHLVLYNLHYFDDLAALGAENRTAWQQDLVNRWIEQNPPGTGPGWEPYPLSLRIVNWIKWHLDGQSLNSIQLRSLATQTQALADQVEYHLLGNHLLANAKALIFAGTLFEGALADHWLEQGSRILEQQAREQVLADGGHFELSPMYHSIILEDFLDLLNLANAYPELLHERWVSQLQETTQRMRFWLRTMSHPDGQFAFFNDAAFGVAIAPNDLQRYANRLNLARAATPDSPVVHLAESGYIRLQRGACVVLIDVARVGPEYQPGHAHADTLSFECSIHGQRIIVNSGTSCYGISDERIRQRSTSAHSTIEVDGENSSEVWSGFRVARRAYPMDVQIDESGDTLSVTAAHDGYRRLPGRVTHCRSWTLADRELRVEDHLHGSFQRARARFPLHPHVRVESGEAPGEFQLHCPQVLQAIIIGGDARSVSTTYHPRFDVNEPNSCLESLLHQSAHKLLLNWPER